MTECSREELNSPVDWDIGDIIICTCDERKKYQYKLFKCISFHKDVNYDYNFVELLSSDIIGINKGRTFDWYTRRFEKWTETKECIYCKSKCKKEEVCAFFDSEIIFPEVGENG